MARIANLKGGFGLLKWCRISTSSEFPTALYGYWVYIKSNQ